MVDYLVERLAVKPLVGWLGRGRGGDGLVRRRA